MSLYYKAVLMLICFYNAHRAYDAGTRPGRSVFDFKKDSTVKRKPVVVDGMRFTAINVIYDGSKPNIFCIKNNKGQVVYTAHEDEGILDFKFVDFNGDGNKDVVLNLMVADSDEQDLVLYDPKLKRFVLAGDCSNAEKIRNTKYFYSSHECCMGRDWSSDLFYIFHSKIKKVGRVEYHDGDGLTFYKWSGKKKRLIKTWRVRINGDTPVTTGPHIDFDLGYYWTKHWVKYVHG